MIKKDEYSMVPENYLGSSTGVIVHNNDQEAIRAQMNQNSIDWWDADAAGRASLEEANRKLAAQLGTGVTFDGSTGIWSGSADKPVTTPTFDTPSTPSYDYDSFTDRFPMPDFTSKYSAQIDAMLNNILNREKFSYDAESDPLYQQYKKQYNREGDRAMNDTMAAAAIHAGGMNSYAMTAAQQANDYYAAKLTDKIPELYQLAYSMYMDDLNQNRADLDMLQGMDNMDYNKYRDQMSDWYNNRDFDYGMFRDQVADSQWEQQFDYGVSRDQIADSQWQQEFDYQKAQDALAQQNWQTQWDYQLQQDALAREDALKKLTSGGNNNNNKTDNQSILKTIYGMDSEDEVYDYLVSRGLNITQTENYMNLYSEHKAEMDRQSSATVENRSDEDGVTISRLGKVSWSRLAQLVEEGKVKEVYDPDNNSYWYQWVEK